MDPLMIVVGLNEGVSRSANPNVPITAKEIARDVVECFEAGASVVHLHARDPHTEEQVFSDPDAYMEIWDELEQAKVDGPVYVTYWPWGEEGYRHVHALAQRTGNPLEIAPVITGSFDLFPWWLLEAGTGDQPPDSFDSAYAIARPASDLFRELAAARRYGLWVSHDVFEPGGLRNAVELFRRGFYRHPVLLKFFMTDGFSFGLPPEPRFLDAYHSLIPDDIDAEWLALPYATSYKRAMAVYVHALSQGGHVRVGIGDNPDTAAGFPATNAAQVEQIVRLAREVGRPVATVADVRARFSGAGATG